MNRRSLDTPLGPLTITAAHGRITAIDWGAFPDAGEHEPVLDEAVRQLDEYFAGRRLLFSLPLDPGRTTPFRRRVWEAMAAIPYGVTLSYGALGRIVGSAPRAIGGACGANPLPVVVPCHRVVSVAGEGGYSGMGGLATKRWLLGHERSVMASRAS